MPFTDHADTPSCRLTGSSLLLPRELNCLGNWKLQLLAHSNRLAVLACIRCLGGPLLSQPSMRPMHLFMHDYSVEHGKNKIFEFNFLAVIW